MRYGWDDAKAAANLAKPGVAFETIRGFDWRTCLEERDERYDYGEDRWDAIGFIDGRLHVVVYTLRVDAVRIISLRRANARERRAYELR